MVKDIAVAHWRHSAATSSLKIFVDHGSHEIDYKKQAFRTKRSRQRGSANGQGHLRAIRRNSPGNDLLVKSNIWCMIDRETTRPARITPELA
jgi:hypothetical protein